MPPADGAARAFGLALSLVLAACAPAKRPAVPVYQHTSCRSVGDCPPVSNACLLPEACVREECFYTFKTCRGDRACSDGKCVASPIRFRVRPGEWKRPLPTLDDLTFMAELTNVSKEPVALSVSGRWNVHAARFERDGRRVPFEINMVSFEYLERNPERHALATLAPGETKQIRFALVDLFEPSQFEVFRQYGAPVAGDYRIGFVYQYARFAGDDRPCYPNETCPTFSNVFHGAVPSNELTFTLGP